MRRFWFSVKPVTTKKESTDLKNSPDNSPKLDKTKNAKAALLPATDQSVLQASEELFGFRTGPR